MKDANPQTIYLKDYQPPEYEIIETKLSFDIRDGSTEVRSALTVERAPGTAPGTPLRLVGRELELLEVRVDGVPLGGNQYRLDEESLTLFDLPEQTLVEIATRIRPEENTALEGLYKSGGMYCTQCEAEGFRRITFYQDRPDVLARFTTTIVADAARYPELLSNGNLVADRVLDDGRREVTWEDPFPKPSYLFALVAGRLALLEDVFETRSGRPVALRIYSEPHNIAQCGYAMDVLKRAMRWDEEVFGREYDLDVFMVVAVEDFNMGAMENKGLNVFNTSCVLASPDTATDSAYQRVEGVVAHEYFHNWSGNRVTCRDWFQLSLKEGFTVFRDAEFSSDMNSRTVKRIDDVTLLRSVQFAEDASPLAHPVRPDSYIEISNFYTPTVYEKGAEVVRMLHTLLGPERFRAGSDLYFERHDGSAATTDDFLAAMAEAGGIDLTQFQRWYRQAGTPVLDVEEAFSDGCLTLTLSQRCPPTPGQPDKEPFHIPVLFGVLDEDGSELTGPDLVVEGDAALEARSGATTATARAPDSLLLHLRAAQTTLRFPGLQRRPRISLLRGFSAPVRVNYPRSAEELAFLALHDGDGFARWDALQTLLVDEIRRFHDHPGGGDEPAAVVVDLFGQLLAAAEVLDDAVEQRFMLAAMLTLPDENYLIAQFERVDVERLCDALDTVRLTLARRHRAAWQRVYEANRAPGVFDPAAPAMARRSLKHAALGFLSAAAGGDEARRLLDVHYAGADNLTDRQAALIEVARHPRLDDDFRQRILDDFYHRWQHEALVVNVWFSAQASSSRYDASRVRALTEHAAFDGRNPNKLRAVHGAFSRQNHRRFHALDGSGYEFLAASVLDVDRRNPSMAASLAMPLTRWRRFDSARGTLMRRSLERMAEEPKLSRDLYEVVSKSLVD
ncbi:MAG: aminopeptidase N [Pseudomonadales bacterium]